MWSGGAIKSTIHRVVYNNPAGTPRFSIPFFLHPSRGSSINCGPDAPAIDSYRWGGGQQ
jgi:isopenicillin N synthase-like dioxygenase